MTNFNVLCLWVLDWIVGYLDGTFVVAEERYLFQVAAIVLESLLHPQKLSTTGSSSNVFRFSSWEWYTVLLLWRPTDKWSTKKMTCAWCRLVIHLVTSIISIREINQSNFEPFGYHNPRVGVWAKYRRIRFTAKWCDSFGAAWNQSHMQTLSIISGLDAHR